MFAVLILKFFAFGLALWFALELFEAWRIAPLHPTGAYTHNGPEFRRVRGWWVREPVFFAGFATLAALALLVAVAVQS